jgi:hypothetical protein
VTTILISFAVDSYKDQSTKVGVFINFARHMYGFVRLLYSPHISKHKELTIVLDWSVLFPSYVRSAKLGWGSGGHVCYNWCLCLSPNRSDPGCC